MRLIRFRALRLSHPWVRAVGTAVLVSGLFVGVFAPPLLAQQASSDDLRTYFQQGQTALNEGRYAEAAAAFEKAAEAAPDIAEVRAALGLSYFQQSRFQQAADSLRRALELKPGLPRTDILLAMSLTETGRFEEALPGLRKGFAQSEDPILRRSSGLRLLRAYSGLGRDRESVEAALDLTKLFPDDPELLYHAGRLFGNFAYLTFSKLSAVAPESVWRHQAAGEAFESEGQIDRALVEYRRVIELEPTRPGIHFRIGRALSSSSLEEAMQAFLAELKIDPTNANAAYEAGEIHRRAGEFEAARKHFEQAIRSYPSFEQARLGLAQTLLSLGSPAGALAHLQAAIELNPENEVSFYRLAQAQRALGNVEEQKKALAEYQRLRSRSARPATRAEVTPQRVEEPGQR